MIRTREELKIAQDCVSNLECILVKARQTHTETQYALLSKPPPLELQGRQFEILEYLVSADEGCRRLVPSWAARVPFLPDPRLI